MSNPLHPSVILTWLKESQPHDGSFNSALEVVAATVHAVLAQLEFRLMGFYESDTPEIEDEGRKVLPSGWRSERNDIVSFRYRHFQSQLTFLVKLVKIADKCIVHICVLEDGRLCSCEVNLGDYVSPAFVFPAETTKIAEAFVAAKYSLAELIGFTKRNIVQKLVPGLNKPGYEESSSTASRNPANRNDTTGEEIPYQEPSRPRSDDFDPLRILPSRQPPMVPSPGGGMVVGPGHPMFSGPRAPSFGRPLPPGAVPPGARFDPISPFDPFNPRPGVRHFSGEPDNDEHFPPGYDNMFG